MKVKDNFIILFIIFAILGMLVTVQIRSTVSMQKQSALTLDYNRLKSQLDTRVKEGEQYKAQIAELEQKKEDFLKASPGTNSSNSLKSELDYLKFISGLTDVTGDGIVITLNDAENPDPESQMNYIIHDYEIYGIINDLRVAGAQAIAINDERLIATSEQICTGPTIKINKNRYAVPFEIKAIGDPGKLYSAIKNSNVVSGLIQYKKRVTVEQKNNIVIPKFMNDINGLISKLEVVDNENKKEK
ncbi:DUF881 domain-containing protein [Ruminiclostridium josui]|uniref:DUF881 domain-containing protein n=1 Tax=Ruminiclostridium josui TaxID=1499 RepID=UPI0004656E12|nr:DUF881 domain-containing protein [Ruminiclostridium josui]